MSYTEQIGLKSYKTIIIGRSQAGKSSLLLRYVDAEFKTQKSQTMGIDYRFKKVSHQDTTFNLEIWDTAGQQRYRMIIYKYFALSKAGVVVFDLTNEDSLNDAKNWFQLLVGSCGNEIPKILLGNKSDLLTPPELNRKLALYKEKIQALRQEFNCEFFAVSAKTGQNVNQAFNYLVSQIYTNNQASQPEPPKTQSPAFKLKSSIFEDNKRGTQKKDKCC